MTKKQGLVLLFLFGTVFGTVFMTIHSLGADVKMNLHQKFLQSNLPFRYSIDEVDKIIKKRYNPIESDIETFKEKDPYYNYDNVVKCYIINDVNILEQLFSDEEKTYHNVCNNRHKNDPISSSKTPNYNGTKMWRKVEEGKLINIILKSDNQIEVTNMTIQGKSDNLVNELSVFCGIESKLCYPGNQIYERYLKILLKAGYL